MNHGMNQYIITNKPKDKKDLSNTALFISLKKSVSKSFFAVAC